MIEPCGSNNQPGWLELRKALWPDTTDAEHRAEMAAFLAEPERFAQFVAFDDVREPIGFVEASIRTDHVNGTESSPVAFLEGIYVIPERRRQGVARQLLRSVVDWARSRRVREFASDAALDNETSHQFHRSLGFAETERVVFFRKPL